MSKFYYHDGQTQQGSFDFEELKSKSLTKETMFWYEGLENWQRGEIIEELSELFKPKTPPPLQTQPPILETKKIVQIEKKEKQNIVNNNISAQQQKPSLVKQKKKTKPIAIVGIVIGGLITVYLIQFGIQILIVNNLNGGGGSTMSQTEMEAMYPENYLDASGEYKENFWGTKMKINGYVQNDAVFTDYKDVRIRVTFYTKTETEISSENYVIYDYFPAGQKKLFKLDIEFPSGTRKLGWEAIGATVNN